MDGYKKREWGVGMAMGYRKRTFSGRKNSFSCTANHRALAIVLVSLVVAVQSACDYRKRAEKEATATTVIATPSGESIFLYICTPTKLKVLVICRIEDGSIPKVAVRKELTGAYAPGKGSWKFWLDVEKRKGKVVSWEIDPNGQVVEVRKGGFVKFSKLKMSLKELQEYFASDNKGPALRDLEEFVKRMREKRKEAEAFVEP